ncbi:hypothetical protein [Streptomyces katrae]|uniref:hypothetical protein n=1 Tax=Streptomyces katrae TaxID=68223 RepID=UPI000AA88C61
MLVEGRRRQAGQTGIPYVTGAESLPWNGGIGAEDLSANPDLWGGEVEDERYALIADL